MSSRFGKSIPFVMHNTCQIVGHSKSERISVPFKIMPMLLNYIGILYNNRFISIRPTLFELQLSFMNFFIFEKDPSMAHELFPKII